MWWLIAGAGILSIGCGRIGYELGLGSGPDGGRQDAQAPTDGGGSSDAGSADAASSDAGGGLDASDAASNDAQMGPVAAFQLDFTRLPLDARVGFTRNSGATYYNASGLLVVAAANEPRIDHDPLTLAPRGLLIEDGATNLLRFSQDLTQSSGPGPGGPDWESGSSGQVLGQPTVVASPSATQTAFLLEDNQPTVNEGLMQDLAVLANSDNYTTSMFLKKGTAAQTEVATQLLTACGGPTVNDQAWLVVTWAGDGSIQSLQAGSTAVDSGARSVGNGWYRVWTAIANPGTATCVDFRFFPAAWVGNGSTTGTVYAWAPQVEVGSFVTSYIPTTSSAATRSQDQTVVNDLSWYTDGVPGTVYVDWSVNRIAFFNAIFILHGGSNANMIAIGIDHTTPRAQYFLNTASTQQALVETSVANGDAYKSAFAFAPNDFSVSENGSNVGTDSMGALPTGMTALHIGMGSSTANPHYGHVKEVRYYDERLDNATLDTLTQ